MNLSAIGWPQGALGSGYPDAPKNLLPGRIEGWPQGTQSSANEAERLLSTAVAWWDASFYRPGGGGYLSGGNYNEGGKILPNRGVAGDLLDLQLGSSDRVATTNDPKYLAPEESGYVYLPGVQNGLSVPNAANLQITGDLELIWHGSADWSQTYASLISKARQLGDTSQDSYFLGTTTAGVLRLVWYKSDGTRLERLSTVGITVLADTPIYVKATLDVDNGTSGHDVKFFTSMDGTTWSQLGNTVTTAGTTDIRPGTRSVEINAFNLGGTSGTFVGKIYRAIIKDGGTTVLDVDCDAITDSSQTSFQAKTGQTVTIKRSDSGRKSVAMPSRYIKKWDDPHVYLPGVDGNYLSVPSEETFDITGDIDVRVKIATDVSLPSGDLSMISRNEGLNNRGIIFRVISGGILQWLYSTDGSDQVTVNSSTQPGFIAKQDVWVRVTHDVDNGAGGNDVKFWKSDDGVSWIQVGTTQTNAGTVSIYNLANEIQIGARGSALGLAGKYYRAIIKNGIDGTTVLDIDTSKAPTNFTTGNSLTFLAETGQTVTLNSTANSGMEVRPARFSRGKPLFLFGSDDYMEVMDEWQHQLLNFDAGDDVTIVWVGRVWGPGVTSATWMSKGTSPFSGSTQGWSIEQVTGPDEVGFDSRIASSFLRSPLTFGVTSVFAGGIASKENKLFCRNMTTGQIVFKDVNKRIQSSANTNPVMIGRNPAGTAYYLAGEFTAAAIFRRALTPEEIATITNYYTTTAPGFQGEPEITAIDLLESSVFWIDPNISEIV